MFRRCVLSLCSSVGICIQPQPALAQPSVTPRALIEQAAGAVGRLESIPPEFVLEWTAKGVLNQSAEHQGRHPATNEFTPFTEAGMLDPERRTVSIEYHEQRLDGSWEHARETATYPDRWGITGVGEHWSVHFESPRFEAEKWRRMVRRFPVALMSELIEQAPAFSVVTEAPGSVHLRGVLSTGETATVEISTTGAHLLSIRYQTDIPTLGLVGVVWRFSDYRPLRPDIQFPFRYEVEVDGRPYIRMESEQASLVRREESRLVADASRQPLGEPRAAPANFFDPSRSARVSTERPGVFLLTSLRTGFHVLFIELQDRVIAIDAPAGYPLLREIPAGDAAPGVDPGALTRRYIQLIRETVPDKPIGAVILTHFHSDHAGGLREFVAAGAEVIASVRARESVERLINGPTAAGDELSTHPRPLRFRGVEDRLTIDDPVNPIEVLAMPGNPHSEDLLAVHLPSCNAVYAADLIYPTPDAAEFPSPAHSVTARYFLSWLESMRIDPEIVYSSHGSPRAGREHIASLRRLRVP
ncbi:MAG TPA: hypothetical protein DEB06_00665 [Phycisphaerales bacterium]|nr:hypothetical protein [Phycisphaerales bacterium]